MCIRNDEEKVAKLRQQMTVLQLWKVVLNNDRIGLWGETGWEERNSSHAKSYHLGVNIPKPYTLYCCSGNYSGRYHCFITRKDARNYMNFRYQGYSGFSDCSKYRTKIIRVHADSKDVVDVGNDSASGIRAISVSKMTIKSLKHQR